jgi:hypothetical protein
VATGELRHHRVNVHPEHEPDGQALPAIPGAAGPGDGGVARGEQPRAVFGEPLAGGREADLPAAALK